MRGRAQVTLPRCAAAQRWVDMVSPTQARVGGVECSGDSESCVRSREIRALAAARGIQAT